MAKWQWFRNPTQNLSFMNPYAFLKFFFEGGFGYDSTDMAAIRYRLKILECDWIIGITDAGQVRFNPSAAAFDELFIFDVMPL